MLREGISLGELNVITYYWSLLILNIIWWNSTNVEEICQFCA